MRLHLLTLACIVTGTACYTGPRAARDVNLAWRGHARIELDARLGVPRVMEPQANGTTLLRWTHRGHDHFELPGGTFALKNAETSVSMGSDKVRHARETGAEVLVASDNSCLLHMGGLLSREQAGRRVMHLAEILASTEDAPRAVEGVR